MSGQEKGRREKLVISTKITGGRNVTPLNIRLDCEGSLKRLGTDYIDVYLLHWPARYTPQVCSGAPPQRFAFPLRHMSSVLCAVQRISRTPPRPDHIQPHLDITQST